MKEASTKNTSIGRGVPPTEKVDKYAMYIDRHKGTNDELSNADKALLRLIDGYQVDN